MNLTDHYNTIYDNPENETCEELGYDQGFPITERIKKSELKECYVEDLTLIKGFLEKQLKTVGVKVISYDDKPNIEIKFCFILSGTNVEIEKAHEQMEEDINEAILTIIK